jgi:hypothetical protein
MRGLEVSSRCKHYLVESLYSKGLGRYTYQQGLFNTHFNLEYTNKCSSQHRVLEYLQPNAKYPDYSQPLEDPKSIHVREDRVV